MTIILGANGKPVLSEEEEAKLKQIAEDTQAFGQWAEERGCDHLSLQAIGQTALIRVFQSCPPGADLALLDAVLNSLSQAAIHYHHAKVAEEKIRQSLRSANQQNQPT